jgi:hypothetical protein
MAGKKGRRRMKRWRSEIERLATGACWWITRRGGAAAAAVAAAAAARG